MMLALALLMAMSFALAETASPTTGTAVPSITIADVTAPEGVIYDGSFVISISAVKEESAQSVVAQELVAALETANVTEYFAADVIEEAAQYLPEAFDMNSLKLEEVFDLAVEGYAVEYGAVEAKFDLFVEYDDTVVLQAMVGVLPEAEDAEIIWIPVKTGVAEGKVVVVLEQEVLTLIQANKAILVLLRAY